MVAQFMKRMAAQLPLPMQHELRRHFFARQIRKRDFATDEKEYGRLGELLHEGDWALDVGANVGHYALRMSELVGATGRVVAFEPVPETFALLAANARQFPHENVSLLNVAASDVAGIAGFDIPSLEAGMPNYYQAHMSASASLSVMTLPIDALSIPYRVALAKIDVEGHELAVIRGMRKLLQRDHPVLIVETFGQEVIELLRTFEYSGERLPGSSNVLFEWDQAPVVCSSPISRSADRKHIP